ncbi:hypothetical protein Fmac_015105 [Flemingia macrophylla]|uniref:Secreted protein n=1 Tax=Flemingia macrophylla TaxID=520843 RepID=A0ABD1MDQ8_9FABA
MMFFQMNFRTFCAVILVSGSASIHFVNKSTATNKNFTYPLARGKGPKISIPHTANGHSDEIECNTSAGAPCYISIPLTIITASHKPPSVLPHCWPIVRRPEYLGYQGSPPGVHATYSSM